MFFPVAQVSRCSSLGSAAVSQQRVKAPLGPSQRVPQPVTPQPVTPVPLREHRRAASSHRSNGLSRLPPLTHVLKKRTMMNPICQPSHRRSSRTISSLQPLGFLRRLPRPSPARTAAPADTQRLPLLLRTTSGMWGFPAPCVESAFEKRCWTPPAPTGARGAGPGGKPLASAPLWALPARPGDAAAVVWPQWGMVPAGKSGSFRRLQ